jgi:hypothetical protein
VGTAAAASTVPFGSPGTMMETGTGRLFVRVIVRLLSPGGTSRGGPGTVIGPPASPNPHMGTTLPSGIVFINTPVSRLKLAAHDVPASEVVKKTRIKTILFKHFIGAQFMTDSSFNSIRGWGLMDVR